MKAAIIVNRHAGRMRHDTALATRLREQAGARAKVYVTSAIEELTDVARELAAAQTPLVGILGGDGTCSYVLTALWQAYGASPLPRIAFLRGGTMNTIADSLGIATRAPSVLLERALTQPDCRLRLRPTMHIGDRLGFLFGTGVWYGYLAESYANGPPTRLSNAAVLARLLASAAIGGETFQRVLQAQPLSVQFAEGSWDMRNYLSIAAGTVAHAGFGFRPFHRAFEVDDAFQLLAVNTGARALLRDFPRLLSGHGLREQTAFNTTTTWAELRSEHGATFGYSVDGEVTTAQAQLRLGLGPRFRFLCL